ncbi:hypothetical protein GW17_00052717 [Ensete ventricosum]|nr:hypothetical protein GW17_00052717 [Ensete ventricosum]
MRGRPRAWLALAGAAPVGVCSARSQGCRLQGRPSYRGSARARRHRPPVRCRPRVAAPAAGAASHTDDGIVRVREEG